MNRSFIFLTIICCILLFIISCQNDRYTKYTATKLNDSITVLNNFSPNFFYHINSIIVSDTNIVILDAGNSRIVDLYKKFPEKTRIFGKKGKGPGEFLSPDNLISRNNKFFVSDRVLRRISIFNSLGEFESAVDVDVILNFAVDNEGNIYVPNIDPNFLVNKYDKSGALKNKFGKKIHYSNALLQISHNYSKIYLDNEENIYLVFFEIPLIRKYDKKMNLIWEKKLDYLNEIKNTFEKNYNSNSEIKQFSLKGLLIESSIDNSFIYIYAVGEFDKKHDIIRLNANNGNFNDFIDIVDKTMIAEKFTVYNNKIYGIDLRGKVYIYILNM